MPCQIWIFQKHLEEKSRSEYFSQEFPQFNTKVVIDARDPPKKQSDSSIAMAKNRSQDRKDSQFFTITEESNLAKRRGTGYGLKVTTSRTFSIKGSASKTFSLKTSTSKSFSEATGKEGSDEGSSTGQGITAMEALNCAWLRLSRDQIKMLEETVRQEGMDPGIHAHSDVKDYDVFAEIRELRLQTVPSYGSITDSEDDY